MIRKIHPLQLGYFALYLFCLLPLFIELPFRPNLYLTWIGSYRISTGEIPFRDFGMPFGVGFWLLPSFLFAIFGPYFKVLVLAQTIINILSLVVVRNILKELRIEKHYAFLLTLIFYSTMCLPNYWPWYNHVSVIYQLTSILFLLKAIYAGKDKGIYIYGILSTLFITLAIFTKQDIGGLGLLINLGVLGAYSYLNKKWKLSITYAIGLVVFIALNILPFIQYEFDYWFNYGQEPHSSRVRVIDIYNELVTGSEWIKFYLLVIVIILIQKGFFIKDFKSKTPDILLALLTLGILVQATIIQYTSFNPPDGNIYFHIFALAFIIKNVNLNIEIKKWYVFAPVTLLVLLWWSFNYNKYTQKVIDKIFPSATHSERIPNTKYTWEVSTDTMKMRPFDLIPSDISVLKGVAIQREVVEGIKRIKDLEVVKEKGKDLKVLNMSELTFLPYELGYETLKGTDQPLWNHLHVAFFDREVDKFCHEIQNKEFDLILFQDVYYSDNYFPYVVRDCAKENYNEIFTMRGPKGFPGNYIHVYIRK